MQKAKNDAHTTFVEVVNSTGWSSDGFAFLFGFLSVSWVMTDYDATAHITEEMKNPALKAPVGILTGLGVTYILGFGLNIALAVNSGDNWPDLLTTPTGLPVAQLFYNVLGKQGGVAFTVLAAVICNFTGASCLQAQARTCFALCRGKYMVSKKHLH
jgi:amino acid transporter